MEVLNTVRLNYKIMFICSMRLALRTYSGKVCITITVFMLKIKLYRIFFFLLTRTKKFCRYILTSFL